MNPQLEQNSRKTNASDTPTESFERMIHNPTFGASCSSWGQAQGKPASDPALVRGSVPAGMELMEAIAPS